MRKYVRNQILEIIPTMLDGVKYAKSGQADASSVLCICYNAAKSIEAALQKGLSELRYRFYAKLIGDIKALLENINTALNEGKPALEYAKEFKSKLGLLKKELNNESEVKLEILFLPYKASMWDALESIFRAAKDDPRCDCYVMPIPYYIAENGQFSKLIYEGNQFPKDVPITDFRKYDISVRKPDVIYIHNPYDECNTLTRVPPEYFSEELKKHTDTLVYSPYFTFLGFDKNLDRSKNFYIMPGAVNADFIAVQSKQHKEQCLKYGFSHDKLLCFGSPKIDDIVFNINQGVDIPDEWKSKLKGKKVFLFNTQIFQFRDHINYFFDLITNLNLFANHPDCAVIWRPHPLALSGVKNYYPNLYAQYAAFINEFKNRPNAIYDDTASFMPAFSASDALISPCSSLINNYLVTGKPVFQTYRKLDDDISKEHYFDAEEKLTFYMISSDPETMAFDYTDMTKDKSPEKLRKIKLKEYQKSVPDFAVDYKENFDALMDMWTDPAQFRLYEFRDMILRGEDPLHDSRIKEVSKAFPNLDGKAGQKIHNAVMIHCGY